MITAPLFRTLLLAALAIIGIYFASSVVMPIIFSGVCAFFLYPLTKKLESLGLARGIASFLVVLIAAASIAGIASFIILEGSEIIKELPTGVIEEAVDHPVKTIDDQIELNLVKYNTEIERGIGKVTDKMVSFIPKTLININNVFIFLVSCPIYIFFMLVARDSIKKCYFSSFSDKNQQEAHDIITDAQSTYSSYLRGLLLVMAIVAVLTGAGLLALGIKYAVFLGLLSGLLTVVPYLGVVVSAILPIVIALLTKDSIWFSAGVVIIFAIVQFLEGNIITPKVMGNQVDLNPLVVILGIVILGALGGIVGMILTIPILALIKVVSSHIPSWKPIYNLLST